METKKREGESVTSLIYRFNKKVKQSGLLKEARKRRFTTRAISKSKRKLSALHKNAQQKEYQRKKKLGIVEEVKKGGRR